MSMHSSARALEYKTCTKT